MTVTTHKLTISRYTLIIMITQSVLNSLTASFAIMQPNTDMPNYDRQTRQHNNMKAANNV